MKNIEAFNDFWLDCYTTLLYSILLSMDVLDKAYIYNNKYKYEMTEEVLEETDEKFMSLCSVADTSELERRMLKNERTISMFNQECPLECVKEMLNEQKVVLLGVDLFYWVAENYHYGKNHINHLSLIKSYDDEKKELIVLETGNRGYQEYSIPYDKAILAIKSAKKDTLVYDLDCDLMGLMYTKQNIIDNAKEIINSIDYVLDKQNNFLSIKDLSDRGIHYVCDILQTHLLRMQNRQKVNRHLYMIALENKEIVGINFIEEFKRLEQQFEILKNICLKSQVTKYCDRDMVDFLKKQIIQLLLDEKKVWKAFIKNKNNMYLKVGD